MCRLLCKTQDFRKESHGLFFSPREWGMYVWSPGAVNKYKLNLHIERFESGGELFLLFLFCFVFKISSIPSCLKNIWRCGTFLEYVVEDLVLSSWTGKTGSSHLLSARLYHGHVYLYSNTGLIEIGNLCIFINVLFCTSVSQQRCSLFCEVFRCMF